VAGDPVGHFSVTAPAEPDGLERIHHLIDQVRRQRPELGREDVDMLEMAVVELAGNVARHGRLGGASEMSLVVDVHHDRLEAELRDRGRPLDVDVDDARLPPAMVEAGRGIAMARLGVDELTYEHLDGTNVWRLLRRRASRR
jgi:serine/threonine-protein kinase RsbW